MESKICSKCKKEKLFKEFYKGVGRHNLQSRCKSCQAEYRRLNRERIIKYKVEYRKKNHKKLLEKQKQYQKTKAGKKTSARSGKKYRLMYPDRCKANAKVGSALKYGKIKRRPCELCGETTRVHAHHEDYSKPLDVVWLCDMHHRIHHGQELPRDNNGPSLWSERE